MNVKMKKYQTICQDEEEECSGLMSVDEQICHVGHSRLCSRPRHPGSKSGSRFWVLGSGMLPHSALEEGGMRKDEEMSSWRTAGGHDRPRLSSPKRGQASSGGVLGTAIGIVVKSIHSSLYRRCTGV